MGAKFIENKVSGVINLCKTCQRDKTERGCLEARQLAYYASGSCVMYIKDMDFDKGMATINTMTQLQAQEKFNRVMESSDSKDPNAGIDKIINGGLFNG